MRLIFFLFLISLGWGVSGSLCGGDLALSTLSTDTGPEKHAGGLANDVIALPMQQTCIHVHREPLRNRYLSHYIY